MRVIFMGTPAFAVPSLRSILDAGHDVPLVVSTPDRKKGRGLKLVASDVTTFALDRDLEVARPESLKDPALADLIRAKEPDVICVVAFRILPESIYSIPPRGSFNLHGSLLPKYRGAAPINWALINGEQQTGVTTFFLQRQVDTGHIILQRTIPIDGDMTAGQLHDVMMVVGAQAVVDTLSAIESGQVQPMKQNDDAATPAPKIFREHCRIDWTLPAHEVHNFVRGLSPHPGAFTMRGESMLKVLRSRVVTTDDGSERSAPGHVTVDARRMLVACGSGRIELLEVQPEGRRAMTADEYLRGHLTDGRQMLV